MLEGDPTLRLADSGEVLQIKVSRPTRYKHAFTFVGGTDREYGATFVLSVTSTAAAGELRQGDRILAVNGTGLLAATRDEADKILQSLPQQGTFELTVLRPPAGEWQELRDAFGPKPPHTYTRVYRPLSTAPLVKQSTIAYLGTAQLRDTTNSSNSGGNLLCCTLDRKPVGIRMAGSYELGGIFITEVKEVNDNYAHSTTPTRRLCMITHSSLLTTSKIALFLFVLRFFRVFFSLLAVVTFWLSLGVAWCQL